MTYYVSWPSLLATISSPNRRATWCASPLAQSSRYGANMLTEHYIWRAIEQAKRIAEKIAY